MMVAGLLVASSAATKAAQIIPSKRVAAGRMVRGPAARWPAAVGVATGRRGPGGVLVLWCVTPPGRVSHHRGSLTTPRWLTVASNCVTTCVGFSIGSEQSDDPDADLRASISLAPEAA